MTTESTIQLSLAATRESPFNPRKRMDEVGIHELAESIKSLGVMQPVVARTVASFSGWELVFGHRRFRAAKLAGLDSIPAFIRNMTDQQVKVAQIHENLEREDVSAIEEADGFRALLDEGFTAEDLIKQTGKSKSYIYGRLKLNQVSQEVREACEQEGLLPEIATLIARIPSATNQRKALEVARERIWDVDKYQNVGWKSARAAKLAIKNAHFTISLEDASFDRADGTLCANGRACDRCPLRSDNDAQLLEEFGADVCTDPDCFDDRTRSHNEHTVQLHRLAGGSVLEGDDANDILRERHWHIFDTNRTHFALTRTVTGCPKNLAAAMEILGDSAPPITLLYPEIGGEAIPAIAAEHLPTLCAALGAPVPGSRTSEDEREEDGDNASGTSLQLPLTDEESACKDYWVEGKDGADSIRIAILRRLKGAARTTDELRRIVHSLFVYADEIPVAIVDLMGWNGAFPADEFGADIDWLEGHLPAMTADELGLLMVAWSIMEGDLPNAGADSVYPARVAVAKAYGVNPLDTMAAPTPSTAALAQEGAASSGKRSRAKAKPPVNAELPLGTEEDQAGSAGEMNTEADGSAAGESAATVAAEIDGGAE
jgi:ParB/RepB/Spo0J family partition protein